MAARLFLIPMVGLGLFCGLIAVPVSMVVVPTVVRCVVPAVVETVVPTFVQAVNSDDSD